MFQQFGVNMSDDISRIIVRKIKNNKNSKKNNFTEKNFYKNFIPLKHVGYGNGIA